MYTITIDPTEERSTRGQAFKNLLSSGSKDFNPLKFENIEVDMIIADDDTGKTVRVELKEVDDFWASLQNGHICTQLSTMIDDCKVPGFFAVYGSLLETMQAAPKIIRVNGQPVRLTQDQIIQRTYMARSFAGDAKGCNIPVHFLSSNAMITARWVLGYAKNILESPNFSQHLPHFPVSARPYAILNQVHGIGDVAAKALLREYKIIINILTAIENDPDQVASIKSVGKAKVKAIANAFGLEEVKYESKERCERTKKAKKNDLHDSSVNRSSSESENRSA